MMCNGCGRDFRDEAAVYEHGQKSAIHTNCGSIRESIEGGLSFRVAKAPNLISTEYQCSTCETYFPHKVALKVHLEQFPQHIKDSKAKREPIPVRYDILVPAFVEALAQIAHYGAEKYGEFNWQKSRLDGVHGPVNHMLKHLNSYMTEIPYDITAIGSERKYHLAAVAFNAMMEFWYESNETKVD